MTAPDPPAVASVPAEAVEAATAAWMDRANAWLITTPRQHVQAILAAALSHLRAQWLAEVDAALRDWERYVAWARKANLNGWSTNHLDDHADYLRDTLAGDGGEDA